MTLEFIIFVCVFFGILALLAIPLGGYIASVFLGERHALQRVLGPVERLLYRLAGVNVEAEMDWKRYAWALVEMNGLGLAVLWVLQMVQGALPMNPSGLHGVEPLLAFQTAVSFVTNTNWQSYSGETTLSLLTQMAGLAVQNFLSAATGMAVAVALARGFARKSSHLIGNFWVDLVRGTLYVLLPLSLVLAVALVSSGVVQTFRSEAKVELLDCSAAEGGCATRGEVGQQSIALGPVASQEAIKQLGTNGGGFYNANSAHPLENPSPISNLLEMLAILLIPAALCFTFGRIVRDNRISFVLFISMLILTIPLLFLAVGAEHTANPALGGLGVDQSVGNMEGKEVRLGVENSAMWATVTTAASNGSVNAMHDSLTPLGGFVPLWLMQTGEVAFGGVGSGLYGILLFAILAVFIAGLMVGRTPELLGKKMGAGEMKMACLAVLLPSAVVLLGTAAACILGLGNGGAGNTGPHGFTEILYAFSSCANNNGSAFAGLDVSSAFYGVGLSVAMLVGRFGVILPVLAIAGSVAGKHSIPPTQGTLPTHTATFVFLLVGTVVLVGALTFIPALALGPLVEHLQTFAGLGGTP